MAENDGVSPSTVEVTEKQEADAAAPEEKKKKKVGGAAFSDEKVEVVEYKQEKADKARPDKRAPVKSSKIIDFGDQRLERAGTSNATSLIAIVDPQDADIKSSCCPKLGKASPKFDNAETVAAIDTQVKMDIVIGSGGFSTIQRGVVPFAVAKAGLMAGTSVAVKCVTSSTLRDSCTSNMFETEVKMATEIKHPNVGSIKLAFQDESMLYLIMEDLSGGDLFDKLAAARLPATVATRYVSQMISGIAYCHQLKLCHRDIRPENYLLSNQKAQAELKLIDFSLARRNEEGEQLRTMVGCLSYVAPEVLMGKYNKKCDIWSVGVVAFLCCCSQLPIYDSDPQSLVKKVMKAEIAWTAFGARRTVEDDMQSLLGEMLTKDPAARPDAGSLADRECLKLAAKAAGGGGCCLLL